MKRLIDWAKSNFGLFIGIAGIVGVVAVWAVLKILMQFGLIDGVDGLFGMACGSIVGFWFLGFTIMVADKIRGNDG